MFQSSFIHKIQHPLTGDWINKLHIRAPGILLNSQKGNPVDTCDNTGESHRRAEQEAEHARMCAV